MRSTRREQVYGVEAKDDLRKETSKVLRKKNPIREGLRCCSCAT